MVGVAVWVSGAGSIQGGFAVGREETTPGLDEYLHYLCSLFSMIVPLRHAASFRQCIRVSPLLPCVEEPSVRIGIDST